MLKIGITGGIGSGKTEICEIFSVLGIPIFNADSQAKFLSNTNSKIILAYKKRFGENIYINSKLNTKLLADIIFNNNSELEFVNSIVHPIVENQFNLWANKQKTKYVVKEAAILFESNSYKQLDKTITVVSPIELRIKRVIERDKVSENIVIERINKQISDAEKIKLSDFVIYNNEIDLLIPQVLNIHNTILQLKTLNIK